MTILLKRWWLIAASVIVAGVAGYVGPSVIPRSYQSHTTLMVGQALPSPNPSSSQVSTGQVLAQSCVNLAKQEPVLKATLEALKLPWDWQVLQGMVTARLVPNTQSIEISVEDTNPQRAQMLASELARQLILQSPAAIDPQKEAERQFVLSQIEDLRGNIENTQEEIRQLDDAIARSISVRQVQDARNRQAALQAQVSTWQVTYNGLLTNLQQGFPNFLSVVEPAQVPARPSGIRTGYTTLLAVVIGLVLSVGAVFLIEHIEDRLKTPEDVRQALGLTTVARIARLEGEDYPSKLVTAKHPRSSDAAAYRMLRTNLQFGAVNRSLGTLMVTSTGPGEGKSLAAANLAVVIAQSGKRVILVDADLWRPSQHRIFQLDNAEGLATVLLHGDAELTLALKPGPVENLSILRSGPLPPNPTDLLGTPRLGELIEALRSQADVVIFDSTPVMADADATILAAHMDGVLFVVDSGNTRRTRARRSMEMLNAVGAHLSGVVLNRFTSHESRSYDYYAEEGRRRKQRSVLGSLVERSGWANRQRPRQPAKPMAVADNMAPSRPHSAGAQLWRVLSSATLAWTRELGEIANLTLQGAVRKLKVYGRRDDRARAVGSRRIKSATRAQSKGGPRWAVLGAGLVLVMIAAIVLSLSNGRAYTVDNQATVPVRTAEVALVASPRPTLPVRATDIAPRPTETVQLQATTPSAPVATAAAGATATQRAVNAIAARQAVGFIGCDELDFQVQSAPVDIQIVATTVITVPLTWRVRNNATPSYCKWGQAGQEVKLLRAASLDAQPGSSVPVKLKWVKEDEYDLSLSVQLPVGPYAQSWRLILPQANSPAGPDLEARVNVVVPTPRPTATLQPTPTPCPEVTYACNCRRECVGRDCTKVCDVCTKEKCD